jgi:single-stranded DNA-specific DHH superfamily exonuclease
MLWRTKEKGVIIHHWDADGLCSAALLLNHLKGVDTDNWTPDLGAFYLTDEQIDYLKEYDRVIITDMALPEKNIHSLSRRTSVTVIDHHFQGLIKGVTHINPVAHGASQEDYPSCTWVISEYLDQ